MRLLDIDLDFFVSEIRHWPSENSRPDSSDFIPWELEDVHAFLEDNCGLSKESKLPTAVVRTHDEVFYIWREQIRKGHIKVPFHLVHIDAHADLGLGDSSYTYILGELLHAAPLERQDPKRGGWSGLTQGNYLAFAISCRWLQTLTYVHHPKMRNDLPRFLFRNHDTKTNIIELLHYREEDALDLSMRNEPPQPLDVEPSVPVHVISKEGFTANGDFTFAYLSVSPQYTPPEAESLIPGIGQYLRFLDEETFLQIGNET